MKILSLLILSVLVFSCSSIKWKDKTKENKTKNVTIKKLEKVKPENWADEYYQKTYFIVHNPKILESYNELVAVCKSKDISFLSNYQENRKYPVKYKEVPINITSNKGFSKSIFISKGACREFSLSKSHKIPTPKQIRKSIKKMVLVYIYNQGTFLKETEFNTPFSDVEYLVE